MKEEHKEFNATFTGGFQRPAPPDTHQRIFSNDKLEPKQKIPERNTNTYKDCIGNMLKEQGKIARIPKVSGKPCNDDFNIFSSEAKKNCGERYYYEQNLSQW